MLCHPERGSCAKDLCSWAAKHCYVAEMQHRSRGAAAGGDSKGSFFHLFMKGIQTLQGDNMNERVSETYTIRLCKHGEEFEAITNVAEVDCRGRPRAGEVIDEEWKIVGVISNSPREICVDVEEVAHPAGTPRAEAES
jgi:hypothetical protein